MLITLCDVCIIRINVQKYYTQTQTQISACASYQLKKMVNVSSIDSKREYHLNSDTLTSSIFLKTIT